VTLTRHCQSSLQAAQQKVEILLKRGGELQVEAFEEPGEEGSAGTPDPQ
jgi:exonuclease VII small subunit